MEDPKPALTRGHLEIRRRLIDALLAGDDVSHGKLSW